jgi:hypothetical protein
MVNIYGNFRFRFGSCLATIREEEESACQMYTWRIDTRKTTILRASRPNALQMTEEVQDIRLSKKGLQTMG